MKHYRSMHGDNPKAVTKSKELLVHTLLQHNGVVFEYQRYVPFAGCGLGSETRCAYLDFLITKAWGSVVLEVDELQHHGDPVGCDVRRDFDILASVALGSNDKLCVARFNPDAYKVGGVTQTTSRKQREARLLQALEDLNEEPELPFSRLFLFYNKDSHESTLPSIAESWSPEVRQVSRCLA